MTDATIARTMTDATTATNTPVRPVMTLARLGDIARRIDSIGVATNADVETELVEVAVAARALHLSPVLAGVLADRDEPLVARHRAFGRLAMAIEQALVDRRLTAIGSDAALGERPTRVAAA